jgi:hypothetical protein
MGTILSLIIGFVAGVVLSELALKLFNIGWKKLSKEIDDLV